MFESVDLEKDQLAWKWKEVRQEGQGATRKVWTRSVPGTRVQTAAREGAGPATSSPSCQDDTSTKVQARNLRKAEAACGTAASAGLMRSTFCPTAAGAAGSLRGALCDHVIALQCCSISLLFGRVIQGLAGEAERPNMSSLTFAPRLMLHCFSGFSLFSE